MTDSLEKTNVLTPELVRSKLQVALTKAEQSIQGLNNAEAKLVYNEDNLTDISKFIENCKAAEKIVEAEREELKKPFLEGGRNVDAGAKLISTELVAIRQKAHSQYAKLCMEVERKKQDALKEANRVKGIRDLMDTFKMEYSGKVAEAKTSQELLEIERRINLETGNKTKYAEFLPEFVEDCKAIRSLITGQKIKVKELADLEKQAQESLKNGSDEQYLQIQDKKEALEAKIAETAINIQETAISQSVNSAPANAEIILPEIKGSRRTWDWEIKDVAALYKKAPHLVELIADKEKIRDILKNKMSEGETKNVSEISYLNGLIRFYVKTTY